MLPILRNVHIYTYVTHLHQIGNWLRAQRDTGVQLAYTQRQTMLTMRPALNWSVTHCLHIAAIKEWKLFCQFPFRRTKLINDSIYYTLKLLVVKSKLAMHLHFAVFYGIKLVLGAFGFWWHPNRVVHREEEHRVNSTIAAQLHVVTVTCFHKTRTANCQSVSCKQRKHEHNKGATYWFFTSISPCSCVGHPPLITYAITSCFDAVQNEMDAQCLWNEPSPHQQHRQNIMPLKRGLYQDN